MRRLLSGSSARDASVVCCRADKTARTCGASRYLAAHWYACGPQGNRPYPMRGLTVVEEAGWTVLGGPVLQHFDTVFDMHGTGRVGWVRKPAAAAK